MTQQRSFLNIGIVYAVGQILLQAISFLLLPLYTHYLSLSEYGQFAITGTISDLIGFLLVLGIYSGYNRFYKEYAPDLRDRLRNTAFTFSLVVGVILTFLMILSGNWIIKLAPGIDHFFSILVYMVINNLLIQLSTIFICDYFLEYRAKEIVVINLVKALSNILLIVYFLAMRHEGIAGIYKGQMIGSLCLLLYFIVKNMKVIKFEMDKNMLSQMLKFGAGLVPSNLSASVLNFSDRFFMARFRNYDETGIYYIGYKFGMQIDPIFTTPFRQVFTTYKYETWNDKDADRCFNDMFLKYYIWGCFFMLCIAIFSRVAIFIFTNSEYLPTYKIVPIILIAYFLFGETRFFNLGIELKNKTYLDSLILITGGLANIGLNLILIPGLGMEGAALATMLSYILIILLYSRVSGRLYRIKYDIKKPLIVCLFAAGLYGLYLVFSLFITIIPLDVIPGILLPAAYLLLCMLSGIVSRDDIRNFVRSLSQVLQQKSMDK